MSKDNKYYDEEMPTVLIRRKTPLNTVSKDAYDKLSAEYNICIEDNKKLRKKVKDQKEVIDQAMDTLGMYQTYIEKCNPYLPWTEEGKKAKKSTQVSKPTEEKKKPELKILNSDGENILDPNYIKKRLSLKKIIEGAVIQVDPFDKTITFGIHTREVER